MIDMNTLHLNEEQHEAVYSNNRRIVCLAGAGTGKTQCLVSRLMRLVQDGCDPKCILVLTFTNAAALEMASRYISYTGERITPEFRTFHAFCYSLLSRDSKILKHLGYSKVPDIASEQQHEIITRSVQVKYSIKLPKSVISGIQKPTASQKFSYELYCKQVKLELLKKNLITFDLLSQEVCELFVNHSALIHKYNEQYQHIIVDEFQDTDPIQNAFVQSFENSSIFVVGDALQNLYSFRGTDGNIIKSLSQDSEWQCIKMNENYRSTIQICNFANAMSKYADSSYRIAMKSHRSGQDVVTIPCKSEKSYSTYIHQHQKLRILDIIDKNKDSKIAVLCRTNAEVSELVQFLAEHDIICSTKSTSDGTHLLKSCFSDSYAYNWLASLLTVSEYADYIRYCTLLCDNVETENIDQLLAYSKTLHKITSKWLNIIRLRNIFQDTSSTVQMCYDNILNIIPELSGLDISQYESVSELYQYLISHYQESPISSESLYIGTIHSVKGLEFDTVILTNVGCNTFRLDSEANMNLYYVGITRAKDNLYVFEGH